jgi:hypothetical protein
MTKKRHTRIGTTLDGPTDQDLKDHPELCAQADIIRPTGFVDSHLIFAKDRTFPDPDPPAGGKPCTYRLEPQGLVLEPMKDGFRPLYVFKEGDPKPYDFTNHSKLVPARVLTLLYNLDTYRILIQMERKNLNLILVILGVATIIVLGIYAWLNYGHGQLPDIPFLSGGK